jgi:hypothetical protein
VSVRAAVSGRSPSDDRAVVPEGKLEQTDTGLVPASEGWFVMNVRDARWFHKPGQGDSTPLTGNDEFEAETYFPMLGMAIRVVGPGEPSGTYHWETEQENFLVLSGEGLLIVEGQERGCGNGTSSIARRRPGTCS